MSKRIALVHEAAAAMIPGLERFAVQAARRIVRLQERRRKLRRELKAVDSEIKVAKYQLRTVTNPRPDDRTLDSPMPPIVNVRAEHD